MNSVSRFFAIVTFVFVSIVVPVPAHGEPADPDPSFGSDGIARLPDGVTLQGMAAYPDGRLALLILTAPRTQSVVRFDASGRVDGSFGPVNALPEFTIDSIAVTRTGRLVTLQSLLRSPTGETRVTRHLDDGTLDPLFGEGGVALVGRFAYSFHARVGEFAEFSYGLTVDANDRLYFPTELRDPHRYETWITRVGATGFPVEQLSRANPFGTGYHYGPLRIEGNAIVSLLHSHMRGSLDGVLVTGPALLRLFNGIPDPTFGSGGIAFRAVPGWGVTYRHGQSIYDFQTTPDGGYVVLGSAQLGDSYQLAIVKFSSTGEVETTFGNSGVAYVRIAGTGDLLNNAKLAVQPDGRIVVAATLGQVVVGSFAMGIVGLGRLSVDGQPDLQFAPGGVAWYWTERGTSAKFVNVAPGGRIVVLGEVLPRQLDPNRYPTSVAIGFAGGESTRIRPLAERRAIEYFHAGFRHYFLTADPHEIVNLDYFNPGGWSRTGNTFRVWDDDDPSLRPACRFWSDQSFTPKSSHFYTPYDAECATVKNGPTWRFERNAFSLRTPEGPAGAGSCQGGSQPLYRAYNNGLGGAPNHRYTTEPAVLDEMLAKGWTMEGEAQTRVFACVPAN